MNHDQTTAELRKRIGQTTSSLNQCAAQDKAIATGAAARFKQVQARMDVVRQTAIMDPQAADEYLDLTKERAALLRTLQT